MPSRPTPREQAPAYGDHRPALILRLHRRLAGCGDLASLLAALAQDLPQLMAVRDRISLAFIEPDLQSLRIYQVLPVPVSPPAELPRVRMAGTVVGDVARDGRARVVADVRADDNIRFGRASHDGIRSTASVPVLVAGRVVGAMNIGSKQIGACNRETLEDLVDVAAVVGPAVFAAERALEPRPAMVARPGAAEFVGQSAAISALLRQARRAAMSDASLLITGETGVGKTMLARAIHGWSARASRPFATVHIADLPASLVEAELFGHERGAFTGAAQRRLGRFESADQGTLFLDEVGEAPLAVQTKLLRFTQDGCFERVGGNATITSDVRIIAATNRDLRQAVASGQFRQDLLFRLEILLLHIPALRERPEDLEPLAEVILARLSAANHRPLRLSRVALARLHAYPWPGNVRELESVLTRAALLEEREELELPLLGSAPRPANRVDVAASADDWPTRDENERRYLARVLQHTAGRIGGPQGASRILGMNSSTLRSRMLRLGLCLETAVFPTRT